MKGTGIVRRMDELGRICIPKELRKTLHLDMSTPFELLLDEDKIVLRKFDVHGNLEELLNNAENCIRQVDGLPPQTTADLLNKLKEMRGILDAAR